MSKCVYAVDVNGEEVLVEATNQAQAIRTATRPLVKSCKALSGAEVYDRMKAGKEVLPAVPPAAGEGAGDDGAEGDPPQVEGSEQGDQGSKSGEESPPATPKASK